ncbi:hypothetical protein S7711_11148 [Stachybotrys chartarum IBT 7711]|uniref:Uncharacterized protein n=1 Tax=Stachybotrys chartarum (strain CBS 109288 / IBT 7711) TaxID=1280523 RepID=A0A084AFN2_STACB|nr:hypothetical protein S7711_11148 [Stachybotrys chartarum IBT 7711]
MPEADRNRIDAHNRKIPDKNMDSTPVGPGKVPRKFCDGFLGPNARRSGTHDGEVRERRNPSTEAAPDETVCGALEIDLCQCSVQNRDGCNNFLVWRVLGFFRPKEGGFEQDPIPTCCVVGGRV